MGGHGGGDVDKQIEALIVADRAHPQLGTDELFFRTRRAGRAFLEGEETGIGFTQAGHA